MQPERMPRGTLMDLEVLGRLLLGLGVGLAVLGGLLLGLARIPVVKELTGQLFNLPGDVRVQSGNVTCLLPIVTMIILSVLLTVVLNIVIRLFNR
jgi:hypothetical protein